MKLSLFFAGVAFAAPNNDCMKHIVNNDAPVMERAMGAVACLERNNVGVKELCVTTFFKVKILPISLPVRDLVISTKLALNN